MTDITLFGETRCPKARFYQAELDERGLPHEMTGMLEAFEGRLHEIRLTCPFLRRVGANRPDWRETFNLRAVT
jgi:hypothetical protein